MKKTIALLCLLSTLGLTGCGNTGALYIPADAPQSDQSQS
ncbi:MULTISPECIES: LPS translocon maturation chaperone LptM [unclassified Vibrio]